MCYWLFYANHMAIEITCKYCMLPCVLWKLSSSSECGEKEGKNGSIKAVKCLQSFFFSYCVVWNNNSSNFVVFFLECHNGTGMTKRKSFDVTLETRINRGSFLAQNVCHHSKALKLRRKINIHAWCLSWALLFWDYKEEARSAAPNSISPENSLTEEKMWNKKIAEANAEWNLSMSMNNEAIISQIRSGELVKWFIFAIAINFIPIKLIHRSHNQLLMIAMMK